MDLDARLQFNQRVLKRYDASITQILGVASFSVLYSFNKEWAKTGVEGPLFLYQRTQAPYYGFLILNRNNPEGFSAELTDDDDLELSNDFIIYRPRGQARQPDEEDEIYGLWIYEPSQLEQLGKLMLKLQAEHFPAPEPKAAPAAQSISLDALFQPGEQQPAGDKAPPAQAPDAAPAGAVHTASDFTGASILNALFENASAQENLDPVSRDGAKSVDDASEAGYDTPEEGEEAGADDLNAEVPTAADTSEAPAGGAQPGPEPQATDAAAAEPTTDAPAAKPASHERAPGTPIQLEALFGPSKPTEPAPAKPAPAEPAPAQPPPAEPAPAQAPPSAAQHDQQKAADPIGELFQSTRPETKLAHTPRLNRAEFVHHLISLLYVRTHGSARNMTDHFAAGRV